MKATIKKCETDKPPYLDLIPETKEEQELLGEMAQKSHDEKFFTIMGLVSVMNKLQSASVCVISKK
jgi:hypothetical protein